MIVDECHRGSAADDAAWRKVLEYFSSATQIGLTATPKETKEISNIEYFGDPLYTYSLRQGIEDGFLAPYKVVRIGIDPRSAGRVQVIADIEDDTVPVAVEDSAQLSSTSAPVQINRTAPRTVPKPTTAKPLKVLVLGDSLSTYTGQRLTELLAKKGLAGAQVEYRNGVGLATPEFFNWPVWALKEIDKVKPKKSSRLQREDNLEADPRGALLVEHWDADDWSRLWWVRADLEHVPDPPQALLDELADNVRQPAIVTDTGSTKRAIVERALHLAPHLTFMKWSMTSKSTFFGRKSSPMPSVMYG